MAKHNKEKEVTPKASETETSVKTDGSVTDNEASTDTTSTDAAENANVGEASTDTTNTDSTENANAGEASDAEAKAADEAKVKLEAEAKAAEEVKKAETKKEDKASKVPHHISFFEQHLKLSNEGKSDQAIKSYNMCIKSALAKDSSEAYSQLLSLFKKSKHILSPKTILQSASVLPPQDRAILEIVSVVFRALVFNPNTPLNLEMIKSVVKSDSFVNWVAKELNKAK